MATSTPSSPDRTTFDGDAPPAAGPRLPPPHPAARALTERLGEMRPLDGGVAAVRRALAAPLAAEPVSRVLSGDWLGHPLHPLLTDVVIGSWTSATLVDLLGGRGGARAADRLAAIGVLSAFPTIAAGWHDWAKVAERDPAGARIGLVHAAANATGLAMWSASLRARRAGDRARGAGLGAAGLAAIGVGGYLGAHLSYVHGARVEAPSARLSDPGEG